MMFIAAMSMTVKKLETAHNFQRRKINPSYRSLTEPTTEEDCDTGGTENFLGQGWESRQSNISSTL